MKLKKILFFLFILLMIPAGHVSAQDPDVLTLALYPYVPDIERFKSAIREEWNRRHPEIGVEFSDWDCYSGTLPENVDVFVYDAVYMDQFLEQGLLLPLSKTDIEKIDDFFPFAINACTTDGVIYAVPEYLCSEFLYTRRDDTELTSVENIRDLYNVIGKLSPEEGLLPLNEGLLISIPNKMSASFWLVQALVDAEQTDLETLFPLGLDDIPSKAENSLWMVREMAGIDDMTLNPENNGPYIYGEWFTDRVGRAYIGFSEAMSAMEDPVKEIEFRLYSMTEDQNIPLFYMDAASVNAEISEEKRTLAMELLNVISGSEVFVRASSPMEPGQGYQYLLSARKSVYEVLEQNDPVYMDLKTFVSSPDNRIFLVRNEDLMSLYNIKLVTALLQTD